MNIKSARPFVAATVTLSFIIISVTGLIMAFHLLPKEQSHTMKGLHEWLSYLFIIGGLFHIYYNWHAITGYFKQKQTRLQWLIAGVICVILMATVLVLKPEGKHTREGDFDRSHDGFERYDSHDHHDRFQNDN